MCGIIGYVGDKPAESIIVNGLERLEYRGYDSAGVAILNGELNSCKVKGKIELLRKALIETPLKGTIGIGHTRWATHGKPNRTNAHPHFSADGSFCLVHNGIIENYTTLKTELSAKGHVFHTETDTEVLVRLIEEIYINDDVAEFEEAVQIALQHVEGTYGVAIVNSNLENTLMVARKGSPLIVGIGEGEMLVSSDAASIIEHTNQVIYLEDGEMAILHPDSYTVKTIENTHRNKKIYELEMNLDQIEKNGYDHFMLKEIYEQPDAVRNCLRGRLNPDDHFIQLGSISDHIDRIAKARRLIIASCGTSWHAGLVGEYILEQMTGIPVEVEYASEFRYRNPIITKDDVLIAISQSGETADTLAAVREAKDKGALVLGICNVVGSTIARETHAGIYTHAGPEIGVASTKAFTTQLTVLSLLALEIGRIREHVSMEEYTRLTEELATLPRQIEKTIEMVDESVKKVAYLFTYAPNFLYMGRGVNFPVALEGALKLKEISYIHAEGYPAAEMKHGPIALIDKHMPVVMLATTSHINDKSISNIEEVKAREARIISITTDSNHQVDDLSEFVIRVPETDDLIAPMIASVPLQLLAYHIAVNRGCEVDQPRNLAKSVTVE